MTAQVSDAPIAPWTGDSIAFVKGHGTENDFVLLPDPQNALELDVDQVRRLCDRRAGIGADGVIRIGSDGDGFVMDYRNADGSLAEMCGNGARVFAAYLYSHRWVPAGAFTFSTRGGRRTAERLADGRIAVAVGPATVGAVGTTRVSLVDGTSVELTGSSVDVGNPHLVVMTDLSLDRLDLTRQPAYSGAQFPDGANIEFVNALSERRVRMRVFERGVGETRSCGTGTVAVAAVCLSPARTGSVDVGTLGGWVQVDLRDGDATLIGPAELVASGTLSKTWWEQPTP